MFNEIIDERPIVKSNFEISEYPEGYDPNANNEVEIPLEQKIQSKVWKFRFEALKKI